jgi:hypothetical protein
MKHQLLLTLIVVVYTGFALAEPVPPTPAQSDNGKSEYIQGTLVPSTQEQEKQLEENKKLQVKKRKKKKKDKKKAKQ